jgi:hypothetical protein
MRRPTAPPSAASTAPGGAQRLPAGRPAQGPKPATKHSQQGHACPDRSPISTPNFPDLNRLGARESGTARLKEAMAAFRAAWSRGHANGCRSTGRRRRVTSASRSGRWASVRSDVAASPALCDDAVAPQNFETRVSFAVMNSSRAGLPACVCSIPRWIAALISPGWVTRSPYPPNARAIAA